MKMGNALPRNVNSLFKLYINKHETKAQHNILFFPLRSNKINKF